MKLVKPLTLAGLVMASVALAAAPEAPPVFRRAWGVGGSDPGQLDSPSGLATDARGNLYVADKGNHRVQKFSGEGEILYEWALNDVLYRPTATSPTTLSTE